MSQDLPPPLRRWRKEAGPGEHRALLVGPAVVSPVQLLCVHGIGTVIDSSLTWAIRDPVFLSVKDSDSSTVRPTPGCWSCPVEWSKCCAVSIRNAGPCGRLEDLGSEQTRVLLCAVSMLRADRQ